MKNLTVIVALLIVIMVYQGCEPQKPEPSQKLKPIADKYVEVWNTGNLSELDAIMDSNYTYYANNLPAVHGIDGLKKVISSFRTAYPDMKLAIEDQLFSENAMAGRWHITGTNTGAGEMHPTGKSVDFWGISIIHSADGKLKEEWAAYDNQTIMEQLGYTMTPPSNTMK